jgi:hypothetical protein
MSMTQKKMTRPGAMNGLAAAEMTVPKVGVSPTVDPLLDAIRAYHAGMAAYNSISSEDWSLYGGEEVVIEKTYGPPLEAIQQWERPATTRDGAIEALRLALEEASLFSAEDTVSRMLQAAITYFEQAA